MGSLTKEEATKLIADLIEEAHDKINKAVKISDEYGIPFYWNSPAGQYTPANFTRNEDDEDDWYSSDEGWEHSSSTC